MGCNTCRSACGDCSEGGITFKRAVRPVVPAARPAAVVGAEPGSNLDGGQAVADLGSDPNSAARSVNGKRSFPELGSDPNSAGHRDSSSREVSASIPYSESAGSYLIDNNSSLDSINGPRAETRRIGVRAQFGDASATNSTTVGRIGIRPQICYVAPEIEAGPIASGRMGIRPPFSYAVPDSEAAA
jgi:hypothetical protein